MCLQCGKIHTWMKTRQQHREVKKTSVRSDSPKPVLGLEEPTWKTAGDRKSEQGAATRLLHVFSESFFMLILSFLVQFSSSAVVFCSGGGGGGGEWQGSHMLRGAWPWAAGAQGRQTQARGLERGLSGLQGRGWSPGWG